MFPSMKHALLSITLRHWSATAFASDYTYQQTVGK